MGKFFFDNRFIYRVSRHSLFFIITMLLFTVVVFLRSGKNDFLNAFLVTFLNAFFFFAYGYISIFILVPYLLFKRYFFLFVVAFISVGFVLSALKFSFSGFIYASSITPGSVDEVPGLSWQSLVINTKDMSFIVAIFAVAKYSKDWLYAERQRKIIESKNAEARLKVLQSQFDPHFLFNTLNNLYALSLKESAQTVDIIQKLKKILRYLLVDIQVQTIELKEEIKLIQNYLSVEQIRYGKRLKIDFQIDAEDCRSRIAPMLFFPIVENCFKHGSAIDAGNPWIDLRLTCSKNTLHFSARNSKPSLHTTLSKSTMQEGLQNLQKRLELIYPGKYFFQFENRNNEFLVDLDIKLR